MSVDPRGYRIQDTLAVQVPWGRNAKRELHVRDQPESEKCLCETLGMVKKPCTVLVSLQGDLVAVGLDPMPYRELPRLTVPCIMCDSLLAILKI